MSESDPDYTQLEQDFGDVMALLRQGPTELPTEAPGEDIWAAIASQVGGGTVAAERSQPVEAVKPSDSPVGSTSEPQTPESESPTPRFIAPVVSLDERRSFGKRFAVLTAVAAAVVLVAVPLVLALGGDSADQRAELLALGGFAGEGTAELSGRTLSIDVPELDAPSGSFYELWLLDLEDGEVAALRSLGRVEADGSFDVPEDVDISEFSVVDVSVEPDDGNPDHSGDSVLRGDLVEP